MRNDPANPAFDARIETAKAEGLAGRKELLERLVRMPMDRVIELPASSLAILGPNGLARLAAMREELAGAGRKAGKAMPPERSPRAGRASRRQLPHPIRSTAIVVLSILVGGLLLDLARPMVKARMLDSGVRPRRVSLWPACPRLDGFVDGCLYTTGGNALSLAHVAELTGIPVDRMLAANHHLVASADTALPKGSRIVIWRGRLGLEGGSR